MRRLAARGPLKTQRPGSLLTVGCSKGACQVEAAFSSCLSSLCWVQTHLLGVLPSAVHDDMMIGQPLGPGPLIEVGACSRTPGPRHVGVKLGRTIGPPFAHTSHLKRVTCLALPSAGTLLAEVAMSRVALCHPLATEPDKL